MDEETNDQPNAGNPSRPEDTRAIKMIARARLGDSVSINDLMSRVYPELKRRAQWLMKGERVGHTFGPSGSELVQRVMEKILEAGVRSSMKSRQNKSSSGYSPAVCASSWSITRGPPPSTESPALEAAFHSMM